MNMLTNVAADTEFNAVRTKFAKTMDWDEINAAVMHVYKRVIERRQRLNRRLGLEALRP